jgi:tRNA nucleotidyltransferase/poly(A) polymerase
MVIKRTDYTAEAVEAARIVLLELTHLLGEYRDSIVIVGGWVPQLLIDHALRQHIGSLDVDVALNHRTLQDVGYKTILQLLL